MGQNKAGAQARVVPVRECDTDGRPGMKTVYPSLAMIAFHIDASLGLVTK